jgi:hypothetical protein
VRVLLDPGVRMEFPGIAVESVPEEALAEAADLVVAIGGDGTMLYASRLVAGRDVPLLGINRGRLGFLADITPGEMLRRLDEVLAGNYDEDRRLMLEAVIDNGDTAPRRALALNDVVLQKRDTGRMLDFENWVDGVYVNTHGGDGLVIATRPARRPTRCPAAARSSIPAWTPSRWCRSARTPCPTGPSSSAPTRRSRCACSSGPTPAPRSPATAAARRAGRRRAAAGARRRGARGAAPPARPRLLPPAALQAALGPRQPEPLRRHSDG